jgi:aspartate carbamoyltransferase catalytic subunit|tara:strand:+ start:320 stop:1234 length:915 start_codon:yes stop_codon:yes gene_type:complete
MSFKNRDIISINDLSKADLLHIIDVAKKMEKPQPNLLRGKILASLFFEPSTRTRLSFLHAMESLGGRVLGFDNAAITSIEKGESLWDTAKITESYCDLMVIRHPTEGSARLAAEASAKPVINAGDGANQHPTQTLLDLYTIQKVKGTLKNLHIGMVGDLKYGRTVHSLTNAMSHFKPTFYFIAPQALQMPHSYLEDLDKKGIKYVTESNLQKVSRKLDILYVTRIQKERFPDPVEYQKYKGYYKLDKKLLNNVKSDMKILHPLPRVDEMDKSLDDTKHAAYFEQAANGIPVRRALLALLLGKTK